MSDPAGANLGEILGGQVETLGIVSAGALLRSAREGAGVHIAALAVALKVPVKKLEALEQDRIDLLPDAVFARALAASVCRKLKVDPTFILEQLPQNSAAMLGRRGSGIQTPFPSNGGLFSKRPLSGVSKSTWLVGALLSFATAALVFLPQIEQAMQSIGAERLTASSTGAADAPTGNTPFVPANTAMPTAFIPTGSLLPLTDSVSATPVAEAGLVALPSGIEVASPAAPVQATSGILTLSAKRESWVKVTDAKGVVLVRRLLLPGESVAASGALPLEAVIGRADTTRVEVRGKLLDLTPVTRDNVARFEVQ